MRSYLKGKVVDAVYKTEINVQGDPLCWSWGTHLSAKVGTKIRRIVAVACGLKPEELVFVCWSISVRTYLRRHWMQQTYLKLSQGNSFLNTSVNFEAASSGSQYSSLFRTVWKSFNKINTQHLKAYCSSHCGFKAYINSLFYQPKHEFMQEPEHNLMYLHLFLLFHKLQ
jgi:hypothetical protein